MTTTDQAPAPVYSDTCRAHYADDPLSCSGPAVVQLMFPGNAGCKGCETHAVSLLKAHPRAHAFGLPDAPAGITIRVFRLAHDQL